MAVKEYVVPYSKDARKRHEHQTQRGVVVKFMVQLEIKHRHTPFPSFKRGERGVLSVTIVRMGMLIAILII